MSKPFSTARVRWMLMVFLMLTPTIILAEAPKFNQLGLLAFTTTSPELIKQGDTFYFPLHPLALLLNANITTDLATGKVTIKYGDISFTCKPESTAATVSYGDKQLETDLPAPPYSRAGTIYIPIQPLLEAFEIENSLEKFICKLQLPGMDSPIQIKTRPIIYRDRKQIVTLPDSNSDLYIVNPDGTGLMRLSYENSTVILPDIFPDGKAIMKRNGVALSLETGKDWRVFGEEGKIFDCFEYGFSADGKLVAATNDRADPSVLLANTDGTEQRVVTDGRLVALSPDGKFLAFRRGTVYYLLDIEQDQEIELGQLTSAFFSPTEPMIVVMQEQRTEIAKNTFHSQYYMFTYTYAGPEKGKIGKLPDGYIATGEPYAQFSPDGKQLVFTRINKYGILFSTADLKQVEPLFQKQKITSPPVFTADGKHVVFCFENILYIMDIDGKNPKVLSPADKLYVYLADFVSVSIDKPYQILPDGRILFAARHRTTADFFPPPLL